MIRAATLFAVALLAACASAPTHYYTLLAPDTATTSPAADPAFQFSVAPIAIPPQVDIPQLLVRQGAGAMQPVESRRWGATPRPRGSPGGRRCGRCCAGCGRRWA